MEQYVWVSNDKKFLRAVAELKANGKEVTEEAVKALYIRYGGLVIGQPETQKGVEEGVVMPAVTGKPIKKGKKALV